MSVYSGGSMRCGAGADIIDLDRYMRSAVRPSREHRREHLVVDAGGVDRSPRYSDSESSATSLASPPQIPRVYSKRYSHDSGLSDSSYVRRRKTHRRNNDISSKHYHKQSTNQPPQSSPSVKEFRVACEKALREQQEQLTRVTKLCERLAQPLIQGDRGSPIVGTVPKGGKGSLASKTRPKADVGRDSEDTSDVSSSSLSLDVSRKDKHRPDSCKTYKIIMTKLDELSHLFASRPRPAHFPSPAPLRRAASSRTVSVCDKLVATEPVTKNVNRILTPTIQTVLSPRTERGRPPSRLGVTHAPAMDIAPTVLLHCYEGDGRISSPTGEPHSNKAKERYCSVPPEMCDLDNPVQFYQQAKHLQALHATTYPSSRPNTTENFELLQESKDRKEEWGKQKLESDEWICAWCRGYWRALCRRLPTLFTSAKMF